MHIQACHLDLSMSLSAEWTVPPFGPLLFCGVHCLGQYALLLWYNNLSSCSMLCASLTAAWHADV